MKKYFLFLLFFLFISFVSADTWTYEDKGVWANEYSMVSGMYPECEGTQYGIYCVGKYYIDVSHSGDQFRIAYRYTSWMEADVGGLIGGIPINDGRIYIEEDGRVPYYHLGAYDYDMASNGDWGWVHTNGGYLGDKYFNRYIVECYENSDCSMSEYCKREGEWRDWKCIQKECENGEEKCVGMDSYFCKDFKWENKGRILDKCDVGCITDLDCPEGQKRREFCVSSTLNEERTVFSCENNRCYSSNIKVDKGKVVGNCGVECLRDSECTQDGYIGEKYCMGNNIVKNFEDNSCMEYKCSSSQEERVIEVCDDICVEGECTNKTFFQQNKKIIIGGSLLLLFILILWRMFYKKKTKKKV